MQVKVLCVKQFWAWVIFDAGKDVENRTWKTNYRGRLYIAAPKQVDYPGLEYIFNISEKLPGLASAKRGGIVGHVNLLDCLKRSMSEWADPWQWNWLLSSPE